MNTMSAYPNFPNANKINAQLAQHYGTTTYYPIAPPLSKVKATDGVKAMADLCESYWLITDAAIVCSMVKPVVNESFVTIEARYTSTGSFEVVYTDGGKNGNSPVTLYVQKYNHTDFPLPSVKMFCTNQVMMLPSEY